jgi:hypothetical protein
MKRKEILINDKKHKLLYVEYSGNKPSYVITAFFVPTAICGAYWRLVGWDFFFNENDKNDLMYFESWSGGRIEDGIYATEFKKGTHRVWKSEEVKFVEIPKNVKMLDKPITQNPFLHAQQSLGYTCCKECGMCIDDDYCISELPCGHAYWDEDDNELIYVNQ